MITGPLALLFAGTEGLLKLTLVVAMLLAASAGLMFWLNLEDAFIQYTGRAPRSLMQGLADDRQGELRLLHYDDADVPIVAGDLSHPYNS